MTSITIIKPSDSEPHPLPGLPNTDCGCISRLVYPPHVPSRRVVMGIAEINPGHSPHSWHTHTSYISHGYKITYPDDFEEIYYVLSGSGTLQVRNQASQIDEYHIETGDTIFFAPGVKEHQLLNTGNDTMVVLYSGSPLPDIKQSE